MFDHYLPPDAAAAGCGRNTNGAGISTTAMIAHNAKTSM
jgi:hypothetical protein